MVKSQFRIAVGTRLYNDDYEPGVTPRRIAKIDRVLPNGQIEVSNGFVSDRGVDVYDDITNITEAEFAQTYNGENKWLLRL